LGPEGIRVNVLSPGFVETPMIMPHLEHSSARLAVLQGRAPLARLGDVGEIARAVRFLLSDEASFITGAELLADGGLIHQAP
jgi:NAD(P)-dependent dehydrogenase (short-subunit alcohol dehydrogenase family)